MESALLTEPLNAKAVISSRIENLNEIFTLSADDNVGGVTALPRSQIPTNQILLDLPLLEREHLDIGFFSIDIRKAVRVKDSDNSLVAAGIVVVVATREQE